jgi:hypothetical protein
MLAIIHEQHSGFQHLDEAGFGIAQFGHAHTRLQDPGRLNRERHGKALYLGGSAGSHG